MSYSCRFRCDLCGASEVFFDITLSRSRAIKLARIKGWRVEKDGWFCPQCQSQWREIKKESKKDMIIGGETKNGRHLHT